MPANGLTVTDTHSLVKEWLLPFLPLSLWRRCTWPRCFCSCGVVNLAELCARAAGPCSSRLPGTTRDFCDRCRPPSVLYYFRYWRCHRDANDAARRRAAALKSNMRAKIQSLRGTAAANNTLERAADVLQDLGEGAEQTERAVICPDRCSNRQFSAWAGCEANTRRSEATAANSARSIAAIISPLLHPLMTSGIVIIFVIFTLLQREDLRNRLIKLAGSHDLQKTTVALNDAAERLSRLFLSQLALNSAFGLVIGTGLWFIGVPSAVLWGILAGIFRFRALIGVFIAAVFPLLLAVAVDPGWSMFCGAPHYSLSLSRSSVR